MVDGVKCGPDGLRCDVAGNVWASSNAGRNVGYSGVTVWNPEGKLIGRIRMPEICGNVCFGGPKRNRLFMAGSQSLYAVYTSTQGRRRADAPSSRSNEQARAASAARAFLCAHCGAACMRVAFVRSMPPTRQLPDTLGRSMPIERSAYLILILRSRRASLVLPGAARLATVVRAHRRHGRPRARRGPRYVMFLNDRPAGREEFRFWREDGQIHVAVGTDSKAMF